MFYFSAKFNLTNDSDRYTVAASLLEFYVTPIMRVGDNLKCSPSHLTAVRPANLITDRQEILTWLR